MAEFWEDGRAQVTNEEEEMMLSTSPEKNNGTGVHRRRMEKRGRRSQESGPSKALPDNKGLVRKGRRNGVASCVSDSVTAHVIKSLTQPQQDLPWLFCFPIRTSLGGYYKLIWGHAEIMM